MSTVIKWMRVGQSYAPDEQDISEYLDVVELENAIFEHVKGTVPLPVAVRIEVHLDGGQDLNMPFGRGWIQIKLPSANWGGSEPCDECGNYSIHHLDCSQR